LGEPGRGPASVRDVPLEQYVLASVLAEVAPAGLDPEAAERLFEVQAIVARTYAAANPNRHAADGFDLCPTTHCQVVDFDRLASSPWRAVAERAVTRTAGLVLVYEGRPAETVFHADCGGHTSAAHDVWGGPARPYLPAQRDEVPGGTSHRTWRYEVRRGDLRAALNRDARTAVGDRGPSLRILRRDGVGRVVEIEARGARAVRLRGEAFRLSLVQIFGLRSIRSTWFRVRQSGDRLVFEGRGSGHGVGPCQLGAQARIAAGASPAAVLAAYYPGTHLARARVGTDRSRPVSLAWATFPEPRVAP